MLSFTLDRVLGRLNIEDIDAEFLLDPFYDQGFIRHPNTINLFGRERIIIDPMQYCSIPGSLNETRNLLFSY